MLPMVCERKAAGKKLRRCTEKHWKVLGPDHPDTLNSLWDLGVCQQRQVAATAGHFRVAHLKDPSFHQKRVEEAAIIERSIITSQVHMAADHHLRRQIARRRSWAMLLIQFGQPNDVEKAVAILRQLAPLVLRLRLGGRSQKAVEALVSLLEELGESEEAEDWWQRLVEFRPGSAAEGELSTVPGSEASKDLPSSSENQAVRRRLLCWRKKMKISWNMKSMLSPLIWAAQLAAASRI